MKSRYRAIRRAWSGKPKSNEDQFIIGLSSLTRARHTIISDGLPGKTVNTVRMRYRYLKYRIDEEPAPEVVTGASTSH